ncbi:MAG: 16S rRNA (cytosine(1402)-N(4))-methyltransferase RsmH [Deltaproteobacteria bacterium]|nr:16S rRNA (cytosine(1402)-N(4))-methyltransferase RsmH [Deltaproteobacteria bacterium]
MEQGIVGCTGGSGVERGHKQYAREPRTLRTRGHLPVMADEVVSYLACRPGGIYVDLTLGGGGHTLSILKATGPDGRVIGLDVDGDAIEEATALLEPFTGRVVIMRENFKDIKRLLGHEGLDKVDGMVLDVGVSSYQLERGERGFSFMRDARLDMRMDRRNPTSAFELVNGLKEKELERIILLYGEEKRARKIARAIVEARKKEGISTTGELAQVVAGCVGRGYSKTHPATRVFQALRIAVNNELENLKTGLEEGIDVLRTGGRMVVISFHSLEDRIVKETFRSFSRGCVCPSDIPQCVCGLTPKAKLLTKKVVFPAREEVRSNPRARSARLRAIERI